MLRLFFTFAFPFLSFPACWHGAYGHRLVVKEGATENLHICSCEHCMGNKRSETLSSCGSQYMCVPASQEATSDLICMVPEQGVQDLMRGDRGHSVPTTKFCANSCIPTRGAQQVILNAQCQDITQDMVEDVPPTGDDGVVDPACVLAKVEVDEGITPASGPAVVPPVESPAGAEAAPASAAEQSGGGASEGVAPAPANDADEPNPLTKEDLGILHATHMNSESTLLSVRAARAATKAEMAASAAKKARYATERAAHQNEASIAELQSLVVQTEIYKQSAHHARETAKKLYAEIQAVSKAAAEKAAAKAVAEVEVHIEEAKKIQAEADEKFAVPPPAGPKSDGALRGGAPYERAKARVQSIAGKYDALARSENAQAHQIFQNAKTTMKTALDYQTGGEKDIAQRYHANAEHMFNQANALHEKAKVDLAKAAEIEATLPEYDANIAHAELHGDALSADPIPPPF